MPMAKVIKAGLGISIGLLGSLGITQLWDKNHYDADGFNGLGRDREGYD